MRRANFIFMIAIMTAMFVGACSSKLERAYQYYGDYETHYKDTRRLLRIEPDGVAKFCIITKKRGITKNITTEYQYYYIDGVRLDISGFGVPFGRKNMFGRVYLSRDPDGEGIFKKMKKLKPHRCW